MNLNGFYAVDFAGSGYVEFPWAMSGENGFTISICCLTDQEKDSGVLVALGTLFSVELDEGYLCLRNGQTYIRAGESVPFKCGNVIAVAYNGRKVSVYCNNTLFIEKEGEIALNGIAYGSSGERLNSTYLRRIAVYDNCLTKEQILKKLLYKPQDAIWQADFGSEPNEVKSYDEDCLQNCHVVDLVYTLDCSQGELLVNDMEPFQEEFTVLCTCCLFKSVTSGEDEVVLLELSDFAVELKAGEENDCFYLYLRYGSHRVGSYLRRSALQWMDLGLVFGEDYINVYLNGRCEIQYGRGYTSGTDGMRFGKFPGYIDHCAIIGRVLTEDEIQGYRKNPPYVFDRGMLYLFSFADSIQKECCEGLALIANGAQYTLAKETGAGVRPEGKEIAGPVEIKEYSDFGKWQVEVLLRLLVEWIAAWMGAYPNKGVRIEQGEFIIEDKRLYPFVYREIVSLSEAQELLANYNNVTKDAMLKLIRKMEKTGALKKLIDYLYQKDTNRDAASALLLAMLLAALAAAGLFLSSLMSSIGEAIAAAGAIPHPPQPSGTEHDNDDEDKEKKKKKTYLSIRQTNIKSELQIDYGSEKEIAKNNNKVAGIIVKRGTSNVKLTAEISCTGEDGECVVKALNIGGCVIKDTEKRVQCVSGEKITVEMEIQPANAEKNYGKWEETLRWTSSSHDGEQKNFLGETSYEIYLLEDKPYSPWTNSININCLEFCAECAEAAGKESKGFAQDYVRWLAQGEYTKSDMEETVISAEASAKRKSYSQLPSHNPERVAVFDAVSFARDFRMHRNKISEADKVYSHALFCRLQGKQMNTVMLSTGLECDIQNSDGSWISVPSRFLLQDSSAPILSGIHYISMDEKNRVYPELFMEHQQESEC